MIVGVLAALPVKSDTLTYAFSTIPSSGAISGPAGSTIGWGYSITNDSTVDWLVTTGLNAGLFLNGTPDASLFDFPAIPPGGTATEIFSSTSNTGLYALTWDATAPSGFTNPDVFTISAEWWTGDPVGSGTFVQAATDENSPYSATVSNSTVTPEPATFSIVVFAMALALGVRYIRLGKGLTVP